MGFFRKTIDWLVKPARWGTEASRGDTLKVRLPALPGEIWSRARSDGTVRVWCRARPCAQPLGSRARKALGMRCLTIRCCLAFSRAPCRRARLSALSSKGRMWCSPLMLRPMLAAPWSGMPSHRKLGLLPDTLDGCDLLSRESSATCTWNSRREKMHCHSFAFEYCTYRRTSPSVKRGGITCQKVVPKAYVAALYWSL